MIHERKNIGVRWNSGRVRGERKANAHLSSAPKDLGTCSELGPVERSKHSGSKARTHTHCRATEPAFWPPPLPDVTSPRDKRASPRAQLDPPALGTPVGLPPLWGRWICSGRSALLARGLLEGPPMSSRRRPGPPAVSRCVFPTGATSAAFSVTDTSRAPRPAPFALVCPSSRLGFPWLVAVSFPLLPKSGLVLRLYPFLLFPRSLV